MRKLLTLTVAALVVASGVGVAAASGAEWQLLSKINSDRQARGLASLTMDSELIAIARQHSARMASRGSLYHNSQLGSQVSDWRRLGENVAYASTVDGVHGVVMGSSGHRAKVLDPGFNGVGVGVVSSGGRLWTTQVFVYRSGGKLYPAGSSPPPQPSTTRKASPPSQKSTEPPPKPSPSPSPTPATPLTEIVDPEEAPVDVLGAHFDQPTEDDDWPGWIPALIVGLVLGVAGLQGLKRRKSVVNR